MVRGPQFEKRCSREINEPERKEKKKKEGMEREDANRRNSSTNFAEVD